MGVIIGVVVGYAFGTHAGEKGWSEISEAWKVIRNNEEVRDLVVGGLMVAREVLKGSGKFVAAPGARSSLRPVA
ncbi:MAG TPA: hypothetical protein VMS00_14570 [Acidimicrobiales bacterium]|nr:hypothetical protein [Acidimicrobiales bacterium]